MARRHQLTEVQISELFDPPSDQRELVRHYTLSDTDLAAIRRCRGDHNRLSHALMLCYPRYPRVNQIRFRGAARQRMAAARLFAPRCVCRQAEALRGGDLIAAARRAAASENASSSMAWASSSLAACS